MTCPKSLWELRNSFITGVEAKAGGFHNPVAAHEKGSIESGVFLDRLLELGIENVPLLL